MACKNNFKKLLAINLLGAKEQNRENGQCDAACIQNKSRLSREIKREISKRFFQLNAWTLCYSTSISNNIISVLIHISEICFNSSFAFPSKRKIKNLYVGDTSSAPILVRLAFREFEGTSI